MVTLVKDLRIKSGDIFFFDTNIWLFLHAPIANYERKKQEEYADLLAYIRSMNRPIMVNSLVIAEVANKFFNEAYHTWRLKPENAGKDKKKDFIGCEKFNENLGATRAVISQILKVTTHVNDEFNSLNHGNVFKEMDKCSFNDAYYLEYGRQKGYKIVTDDGDFYKNNTLGVEIITLKN